MQTNFVKHARSRAGSCEKCGKPIPVGAAYKWLKGRYTAKRVRCDACPDWRPSERTGSDKLSRLYAARETVEDALEAWDRDAGDADDLKSALETAASEASDVAEEYREAASAWNDAGPASDWNEKADQCDSWSQELENAAAEIDDFDPDAEDDEEAVEEEEAKKAKKPVERLRAQLPLAPPIRVVAIDPAAEQAKEPPPSPEKAAAIDARTRERREQWATEIEDKVQGALDALEL